MCDAIITNGGLKNCQKRCKTFAMEDASNTVQILVACAMQGIRFSSINCLRWGGTKETGSQMKACAIHNIRFTRMNCLWLGNTKEMGSLMKVCAIYSMRFTRMNCLWLGNTNETVSQIKVCVIEGIRFRRIICLRLGNRTETGKPDQSVCDWWHTLHMDELFAISHNKLKQLDRSTCVR